MGYRRYPPWLSSCGQAPCAVRDRRCGNRGVDLRRTGNVGDDAVIKEAGCFSWQSLRRMNHEDRTVRQGFFLRFAVFIFNLDYGLISKMAPGLVPCTSGKKDSQACAGSTRYSPACNGMRV